MPEETVKRVEFGEDESRSLPLLFIIGLKTKKNKKKTHSTLKTIHIKF